MRQDDRAGCTPGGLRDPITANGRKGRDKRLPNCLQYKGLGEKIVLNLEKEKLES